MWGSATPQVQSEAEAFWSVHMASPHAHSLYVCFFNNEQAYALDFVCLCVCLRLLSWAVAKLADFLMRRR